MIQAFLGEDSLNTPNPLEKFEGFAPIIDFHVHAFPDKVASKAIESLQATYDIKCFSDGIITSLLSSMTKSGVDISVILPVSTDPKQVVSINTWASGLSKIEWEPDNSASRSFNRPIIGFGTMHPDFDGYRDEILRMKELGIKGVKFQPSFQKFYPDEEKMFPVYEEIIKSGMIILFHAGDEIKPVKTIYSTPPRLAKILDTFDSATIIAAHLGGYRLWDQVEEFLLGRDIYFDVSYVFGHLDSARAVRIIRSHGVDKIVFGSDLPFAPQQKDIQIISQLDLTQEEKENILGKNALRLLNLNGS